MLVKTRRRRASRCKSYASLAAGIARNA